MAKVRIYKKRKTTEWLSMTGQNELKLKQELNELKKSKTAQ
ncbi:hypothetical protein [Legionella qingyii]|nr:hypothetical protein [Legionella qingyii]